MQRATRRSYRDAITELLPQKPFILRAQWTKLIFNAATNPVGALTSLHHGAATRFEPTGRLFNDLIAEGEAVAGKLKITLHGDPRELVKKGANAPGKHRASMLQDVLAR